MENGASWFAMDDQDIKKRKLASGHAVRNHRSSRLSYESRRMLNTYPLHPPDYHIDSDRLLNDFVEYDVRYAGLIPGVPGEIDVTNRTDVLRIIDRGKKQGKIPLHLTYEDDAILSISKNNIKITRRDGAEKLLLRIPIHEIAAICYIRDDGLHTLSIKHGNPENCDLAVLYCDSQTLAEGLCSLVGQCFQLVYQEATLQLLEDTIDKIDRKRDNASFGSTDSPTTPTIIGQAAPYPSYLSGSISQVNLPQASHKGPRAQSETSETSTRSKHAELIRAYMEKLPSKFNIEELTQFANLMRALNEPSARIPFSEFCERVYVLYGSNRRHLLGGLCPFIPEKDYPSFVEFLEKNGISIPDNGHGTISSHRSYRRSISDISTTDTSDLDFVLDQLSAQFERIDASVGDVRVDNLQYT